MKFSWRGVEVFWSWLLLFLPLDTFLLAQKFGHHLANSRFESFGHRWWIAHGAMLALGTVLLLRSRLINPSLKYRSVEDRQVCVNVREAIRRLKMKMSLAYLGALILVFYTFSLLQIAFPLRVVLGLVLSLGIAILMIRRHIALGSHVRDEILSQYSL